MRRYDSKLKDLSGLKSCSQKGMLLIQLNYLLLRLSKFLPGNVSATLTSSLTSSCLMLSAHCPDFQELGLLLQS